MSFVLDISDDWAYFDGNRSITYTSVTSGAVTDAGTYSDTETDTTITTAVHRSQVQAGGKGERMSGGAVQVGDYLYSIPVDEFAGPPSVGDKITDGAETLRVVHFQIASMNTRWRVFARSV